MKMDISTVPHSYLYFGVVVVFFFLCVRVFVVRCQKQAIQHTHEDILEPNVCLATSPAFQSPGIFRNVLLTVARLKKGKVL